MEKESLIKVRNMIIENLNSLNINNNDKAELIMNLWLFLCEENYEDNIKILRKYGGRKWNTMK